MRYESRGISIGRWCVLTGAIGGLTVPVSARCQYEATMIDVPGCPIIGPPPSSTRGLNNHGVVVGGYRQCDAPSSSEAFRWSAATGLTTLPRLGYAGAEATDVNDQGEIVGYLQIENSGRRDAAFWRDGQPINIGTTPGWTSSEARAINRHGLVAGYYRARGDRHGFVWSAGTGEMIDLGPTIGADFSEAFDVNDRGQVVGWRANIDPHNRSVGSPRNLGPESAFLWEDGVVTDLGVLPGGAQGRAKAINNRGEVVGWSKVVVDEEELFRAFHWKDGFMRELPPLPGDRQSTPSDINDAGIVIGLSYTPFSHSVVWIDGVPHVFEDLVSIDEARANGGINRASQIAGSVRGDPALLNPASTVEGDVDCDQRVGTRDLTLLLSSWGACHGCPADLDHDGHVGSLDLFNVLNHWGN